MATNQDRINEIYNSSDDPWSTHGDELNSLVADRDGEYTGGGSSGSGGNNTSSNNSSGESYTKSFFDEDMNSNDVLGAAWDWLTGNSGSDLDPAQYSINEEGLGQVTGGYGDSTFSLWALGNNIFHSIIDPIEAAKLNPYWIPYDADDPNSQGGKIAGYYDKTRDVNGDGLPDFDSSGNMISIPDEWAHQRGTFNINDINNMAVGEEFKIGHTTYRKSDSGTFDKLRADGTIDDGDRGEGQPSDFDNVVAEAVAKAQEMAKNKLSDKTYADLIDEGYTEQQARDILEGKFVLDPKASITDQTKDINVTEAPGTTIDAKSDQFDVDLDGLNINPNTAGDATGVTAPDQPDTATYDAQTTKEDVAGMTVDTTKGKVKAEDLVDPEGYTIDMTGVATGVNKDGSINETGKAIANYANQGITHVIDTSTISGQAAAAALGAGNYIDSKATVHGQIEILSKFFVDSNGNPKIPTFAQGLSREVARTISMKGVSGTAAMGAMSAALMESMIPIASEDATFFQTITEKNLDNRQEAIINKAKVLARFEEVNLNARETAAVQNAKHFFEMNLENLNIENEHAVIEFQAKVDSIFEDAKAINAQRLFTAEETNDANQFYDNLSLRAKEFTATAIDTMKRFNTGEINDMAEFNAKMENEREIFYRDMQYAIEVANAKWRQTIETTNTKYKFDAAADDAQNMFDINADSLHQIWDTVDSILANAWKSEDNVLARENALAIASIQAAGGRSKGGGILGVLGNIAGAILGTDAGAEWFIDLWPW